MVKELACERECSRGEDYRLIKLTIIDYNVGIFASSFIFILLLTFILPFFFLLNFSLTVQGITEKERTKCCCGV